MNLENARARALVTGGAQGMGATFVAELEKAGGKVFWCDVSEGLDAVANATRADVSNEDDVARLFAEAEAYLGGPVNVLINNAGIIRDGLLVKKDRDTGEVRVLSKQKWDAVIAQRSLPPHSAPSPPPPAR